MKTINVSISGLTPLLMNNPAQMTRDVKTGRANIRPTPEEDAQKSAYIDKDGRFYIPGRCVYSFILASASGYKLGKRSAVATLAGCVRVEPEEIVLEEKSYEIDLRRVVIQKQGILKARAKFNKWHCSFKIIYDDSWIPKDDFIRQIFEDGGRRVGLLDYRPAKRGPYGTFEVVKWELI